MDFLSVILTALMIVVPAFIEAVRANQALDRALVERGLLDPSPGAAPGASQRGVARRLAASWRYRTTDESFERTRRRNRLCKELAADPEIGPLGHRARRLSTVAILLWLICLPLAIAILLVLDPIVGSIVPGLRAIGVPLMLAGLWAGWFALARRGAAQPRP